MGELAIVARDCVVHPHQAILRSKSRKRTLACHPSSKFELSRPIARRVGRQCLAMEQGCGAQHRQPTSRIYQALLPRYQVQKPILLECILRLRCRLLARLNKEVGDSIGFDGSATHGREPVQCPLKRMHFLPIFLVAACLHRSSTVLKLPLYHLAAGKIRPLAHHPRTMANLRPSSPVR